MTSLVKRDSKNAGTITATAAEMAPFISTRGIRLGLGSGIAPQPAPSYSRLCYSLPIFYEDSHLIQSRLICLPYRPPRRPLEVILVPLADSVELPLPYWGVPKPSDANLARLVSCVRATRRRQVAARHGRRGGGALGHHPRSRESPPVQGNIGAGRRRRWRGIRPIARRPIATTCRPIDRTIGTGPKLAGSDRLPTHTA